MNFNKFGKNTTAKILSVLFAIVLWIHISTKAEYDYKVSIPITYIEPSSGYMLASTPPEETQVYLRGSGKNLFYFMLRSIINSEGSYIPVNLAGLPKGRHQITLDKTNIFLSTDGDLRIDSILYNSFFPVVIDKKIERTVKVNTDSLPGFELENGFVLFGKPSVKPESVTVEGPEDIINTLSSIRIATLADNVISQEDSLVHAKLNNNIHFVIITPDAVDIHFPVEPLRTKLFRGIPVTFENFPNKIRQHVTPDTLSVYIQGPESIVSRSRSEDIFVTVNYKTYLDQIAQGDSLLKPVVMYPEGITSVSTTPGVLRISDYSSGS